MDQNTKPIKLPAPKNLKFHRWTNEEIVFKRKQSLLNKIQPLKITLKSALWLKLEKSVFGQFLKELNAEQHQDKVLNENKLCILQWNLKRYNDHDTNIIRKRNEFLEDHFELLLEAVNDCDMIDLSFLCNNLRSIRLNCCWIKEMDNSLQQFKHIKILTLSGNFLKDISGNLLPRGLIFLELFDNLISDLSNLVHDAPKTIKHLGLARNRLTDDSSFHLLGKSRNFSQLVNIDLSDNDICIIKPVIDSLKNFYFLRALSVEGNPCWVQSDYNNLILQHLPWLLYLDNTEILESDREEACRNRMICEERPQMIFRCYRILGLPQPPKDNRNTQTIHVEVNFPLLIENNDNYEANEEIENVEQSILKQESKEDDYKDTESRKSKNKTHQKEKIDQPKKEKKKSYYNEQNEYNKELEARNVWFKTERMPWAKIIEFPPIEIDGLDVVAIRDTFRSIIPVRIVYLTVAHATAKQKKPSPTDKPSKKDKKDSADFIMLLEEKPEEIILKKITLASFYCKLKSINWSDKMMDFYWAHHPDMADFALHVNGSLEALDYELNPTLKNPKQPGSLKKELPPNILTCQVGFGLKRR